MRPCAVANTDTGRPFVGQRKVTTWQACHVSFETVTSGHGAGRTAVLQRHSARVRAVGVAVRADRAQRVVALRRPTKAVRPFKIMTYEPDTCSSSAPRSSTQAGARAHAGQQAHQEQVQRAARLPAELRRLQARGRRQALPGLVLAPRVLFRHCRRAHSRLARNAPVHATGCVRRSLYQCTHLQGTQTSHTHASSGSLQTSTWQ